MPDRMPLDPDLGVILSRIETNVATQVSRAALHEQMDERRFLALEAPLADAKVTRDKTLQFVEEIKEEIRGEGDRKGLWESVRRNADDIESMKKMAWKLWAAIGAVALIVLAAVLNYLLRGKP